MNPETAIIRVANVGSEIMVIKKGNIIVAEGSMLLNLDGKGIIKEIQ